ncbi:hypothetical protein BG003_000507 [Podila horticola]|nr:hypothetical protein BG003_000507 [Podila horticola]
MTKPQPTSSSKKRTLTRPTQPRPPRKPRSTPVPMQPKEQTESSEPTKIRKTPIKFTDDHAEMLIQWFEVEGNWRLTYIHRRKNSATAAESASKLRRDFIAEMLGNPRILQIPVELITGASLMDKWGRMYSDMVKSAVAKKLRNAFKTGHGINYLEPNTTTSKSGGGKEGGELFWEEEEGDEDNTSTALPSETLTRKENPILRESNDDDDAVADLHHLFDLNPVPVDAEKENERDEVRGPAEEEEEEETLVRRRPLQPLVPISVQDNSNHNDNHERVRHSINKGNCTALRHFKATVRLLLRLSRVMPPRKERKRNQGGLLASQILDLAMPLKIL